MNDFVGLKSFNSFIESKGLLDKFYLSGFSARIMRRLYSFKTNPFLPMQVRDFLEQELESGFARYAGVHGIILCYFKKMERFIRSIPTGD